MKKGTESRRQSAAINSKLHQSQSKEAELEAKIIKQVNKAQRRFTDKLLLEAYGRKQKLLKLSFWQGIMFGLGSAIGGTLVLALLIWLLARVVDWFPILGDLINKIIEHTARR